MAETVILPEQQFEFSSSGIEGLYFWEVEPAVVSLTAGETYIVEWNGERHSCLATEANFVGVDGIGLGNFALAGLGENNNMPFLFGTAIDGSFSACYTTEQNTINSVAVYSVTEEETGGDSAGTESSDEEGSDPETPEETQEGIILKDRKGNDVAHYGVETLTLDTTTEGKQQTFTKGVAVEGLEIVPDFSTGDMAIVATEGTLVKSAVIRRPEDLVPEKIAEGEYIAGVGPGTFRGGPDEPYIVYTLNDAGEPVAAKMYGFTTIPAGCFQRMFCLETVDFSECPSITAIGAYAFANCTALQSFEIPESVTSIGAHAFDSCTALTSLTIPDGVTSIPNYMVANCTSLENITLPDGVISIGEYAFYQCPALAINFVIPAGVTSIEANTFRGSGITGVTIHTGVTSIGNYAFLGCKGLQGITIPDSVTSLGAQICNGCTSLTNATISANGALSTYFFSGCTSLLRVDINNGITSIGARAFQNCTALTTVYIPRTVTSIDVYAFTGCTALNYASFETTSTWKRYTSSTATSGTTIGSSYLANTSTAATYLSSTYVIYCWKRS